MAARNDTSHGIVAWEARVRSLSGPAKQIVTLDLRPGSPGGIRSGMKQERLDGWRKRASMGSLGTEMSWDDIGERVGCCRAHACKLYVAVIIKFVRAYDPSLSAEQAHALAQQPDVQHGVKALVEKVLSRA